MLASQNRWDCLTGARRRLPGAVADRAETMTDLPTGTVTLLFTDIEGSTRLLEAQPEAYRAALARHHLLVQQAVHVHGGVIFETVGEGTYAAFANPTQAARAALDAQ